MTELRPAISVVPANEASWEDLQAVFGTRGASSSCQCQRYKLPLGEAFAKFPVEERAHRLRQQTDCGDPESVITSGFSLTSTATRLACARSSLAPRTKASSATPVPWEGREQDKTDDSIWAVTCLLTRAGSRKRGVSRALARAAVDFARERGARAIEACPMTTKDAIAEELHVGTHGVFAQAGIAEVSRPTPRRVRDAHRLPRELTVNPPGERLHASRRMCGLISRCCSYSLAAATRPGGQEVLCARDFGHRSPNPGVCHRTACPAALRRRPS